MNRENSLKPSVALNAHRAEIRKIVEANRASNARVFGSVRHGDDTDESDLDILVEPLPGMTLLKVETIRYKLSELAGVQVDVLTLPVKLPGMRRDEQALLQGLSAQDRPSTHHPRR
jgi:hypothetical protein